MYKFFKNSGLYLLVLFVERSLIFFISPLLVNNLPLADYGSFTLFLTFESAIMPIVSLNLYSAISKKFYYEGFNFKESTCELLLSYLILSVIFIIIVLLFQGFLLNVVSLNRESIVLSILTALLSSFLVYVQTYYKLSNKILSFGLLSIIQSTVYFLTFYFVVKYMYNDSITLYYTRFWIYLLVLFSFIFFTKNIKFSIDVNKILNDLKLTLPTVIFSVSAFLFVMSDRFFIEKFLGKNELGKYAAIYQIPALISLITGSFSSAWIPWLFENLKEADLNKKKYLVRIVYLLIIALISGSILFYFLMPLITKILFPSLISSSNSFALFFVFGFLFQGIYNMFSPFVFYSGKTKFHAFIGIFVAVFSVSSNYVLINKFGLLGASLTFAISWFILALLFFISTFYSYPMPWFDFKKSIYDNS